ncbi:hypothetical protein P3X46_017184 [Hevea brasiliensis]|uniref:Uncharacterized protein n=1 Tax=Hevea brasiliensis TaxID=3981 RepID=A0ABQ9M1G3_HEVBR|nr:protein SOB FIVE-LIKE 2-like [Hevea brasiliensis]KAJ9174121.1 hypothetical protein P3X46_017184 [Hevea brasiliensis]
MESSQLFGGPEECNSSESGWTMYLGSPIDGDDDDDQHGNKDEDDEDDDDDDDDGDGGNGKNYHHEDHSDDSMASDASSGPSHQGTAHDKLQKDFDGKHLPEKKHNKKEAENQQKTERRRKKIKKWDLWQEDHNKNASAQSTSKARESISWMGKRK